MKTITVSYEASAKGHYKAVRQVQKSMPSLRRIHIAIGVLFFAVVVIDGTLVALTGVSEIGGPRGWVLLGGGIVGVFALVRLLQRWHIKTQFRSSPASQGTMTYDLSPSGFTVTGDKFHTAYTWDSITRVARSEDFVLLFISASGAYFFPKNLVDEAEFEQIHAWVEGSGEV